MAKTPEEMAASMVANLNDKTGKDLDQWLALVRTSGLLKHGAIVALLKKDHGVTHGYANLIAQSALAPAAPLAGDELIDAQYAGPKADLRPIYEALAGAVGTFGEDVEMAPKKAYVSLRRRKQFGLIQPSSRTRVDVGINLPGRAGGGRLEASGCFNAMVSHRVRLSTPEEVDTELIGWLKEAYEQA